MAMILIFLLYCSLYQFDSQNHGWKMFPFETTLKRSINDLECKKKGIYDYG